MVVDRRLVPLVSTVSTVANRMGISPFTGHFPTSVCVVRQCVWAGAFGPLFCDFHQCLFSECRKVDRSLFDFTNNHMDFDVVYRGRPLGPLLPLAFSPSVTSRGEGSGGVSTSEEGVWTKEVHRLRDGEPVLRSAVLIQQARLRDAQTRASKRRAVLESTRARRSKKRIDQHRGNLRDPESVDAGDDLPAFKWAIDRDTLVRKLRALAKSGKVREFGRTYNLSNFVHVKHLYQSTVRYWADVVRRDRPDLFMQTVYRWLRGGNPKRDIRPWRLALSSLGASQGAEIFQLIIAVSNGEKVDVSHLYGIQKQGLGAFGSIAAGIVAGSIATGVFSHYAEKIAPKLASIRFFTSSVSFLLDNPLTNFLREIYKTIVNWWNTNVLPGLPNGMLDLKVWRAIFGVFLILAFFYFSYQFWKHLLTSDAIELLWLSIGIVIGVKVTMPDAFSRMFAWFSKLARTSEVAKQVLGEPDSVLFEDEAQKQGDEGGFFLGDLLSLGSVLAGAVVNWHPFGVSLPALASFGRAVEWIVGHLKTMVVWCYQQFTGKALPLTGIEKEVVALCNQVQDISVSANQVGGLPSYLLANSDKAAGIKLLVAEFRAVVERARQQSRYVNPLIMQEMVRREVAVNELDTGIRDYEMTLKDRCIPVWISLVGEKGVGKTTMMKDLACQLYQGVHHHFPSDGRYQGPFDESKVFNMNQKEAWWDAYHRQPVILLDEAFQVLNEDLRAELAMFLMTAVSPAKVMCAVADLKLKGRIALEPDFLITTRNHLHIDKTGIKEPHALLDRQTLLCTVVPCKRACMDQLACREHRRFRLEAPYGGAEETKVLFAGEWKSELTERELVETALGIHKHYREMREKPLTQYEPLEGFGGFTGPRVKIAGPEAEQAGVGKADAPDFVPKVEAKLADLQEKASAMLQEKADLPGVFFENRLRIAAEGKSFDLNKVNRDLFWAMVDRIDQSRNPSAVRVVYEVMPLFPAIYPAALLIEEAEARKYLQTNRDTLRQLFGTRVDFLYLVLDGPEWPSGGEIVRALTGIIGGPGVSEAGVSTVQKIWLKISGKVLVDPKLTTELVQCVLNALIAVGIIVAAVVGLKYAMKSFGYTPSLQTGKVGHDGHNPEKVRMRVRKTRQERRVVRPKSEVAPDVQSQGATEDLAAVFAGSLVEVNFNGMSCYALGILGNLYMTTSHCLERLENDDDLVTLNFRGGGSMVSYEKHQLTFYYHDAEPELVWFAVPKGQFVRDLRRFFKNVEVEHTLAVRVRPTSSESGGKYYQTLEIRQTNDWFRKDYQTLEADGQLHGMPNGTGYCGLPYYTTGTKAGDHIFGIHIAGAESRSVSYFVAVHRDLIDEVVEQWKEDHPNIVVAQCRFERSSDPQVHTLGTRPVRTLEKGMRMVDKTRLVMTDWHPASPDYLERLNIDHVPTREPPRFTGGAGKIAPLSKQLCKFYEIKGHINLTPPLDFEVLDSIKFDELLPPGFNTHRCPIISLDEAVRGNEVLEPMDLAKSSGFPYTVDHVSREQVLFAGRQETLNPNFVRECEALERVLEEGPRGAVFIAQMKDELLPIGSEKVRLFFAGEMTYLALTRKYLGMFCVELEKASAHTPISVGINPHSTEWADLYHRLCGNDSSNPNVCAGDFSGFDFTIPGVFTEYFIDFVNYANPLRGKAKTVRENLIRSLMAPYYLVMKRLFQVGKGNSSGNLLTAIINSFFNWLFHVFAWLKLGKTQAEWLRAVACAFYGDDSVVRVTGHDDYNMVYLAHFASCCGMCYTAGDKQDVSTPYVKLLDATYLKRGFRPVGRFVYAPLELASIYETPMWVWKNSQDINADICSMLRSVLIELRHHGEHLYNTWRDKALSWAEFHKVNLLLPSYRSAMHDLHKSEVVRLPLSE